MSFSEIAPPIFKFGLDDEALGEACGGTYFMKAEDMMEVDP